MVASYAIAIPLSAFAGSFSSVGQAIQARYSQPSTSRSSTFLPWTCGVAMDALGGAGVVLATSMAPVSVVQVVASSGLATLALIGHQYLGQRLSNREWLGVLLAVAGTIAMGAAASDNAEDTPGAEEVEETIGIVIGIVMASALWLDRKMARIQKRLQDGEAKHRERRPPDVVQGIIVGGCFGASASCTKAGFIFAKIYDTPLYAVFGIGLSLVNTAAGVLVRTRAMRDGSAVVICSSASMSTIAMVVVVGAMALGERLPHSTISKILHCLALALISVAVLVLSSAPTRQKSDSILPVTSILPQHSSQPPKPMREAP